MIHKSTLPMLRFMRVLGVNPRMDILRFLADGPRSAADVAAALGKRSVHQHLEMLRSKGVLVGRPSRYAIAKKVDHVSSAGQHVFTFEFDEHNQFSLTLNPWKS